MVMKLSLKPQHLKRYRQIASLMLRFGFSELVRSSGLEDLLGEDLGRITQKAHPKPGEFARELEEMGPTFVKLGQVLSTRGDLIPAEYLKALSSLQDDVEPQSFELVEQVVTEEFGLGIAKTFRTFEPEPLAAASLGQVHKATLGDGRTVAVKVQRQGIRARLADDLDVLDEVASTLESLTEFAERFRFKGIVQEFRRTLMRELDYRTEAANLATLRDNLADFKEIFVPQPIDEFTTSRVLTMDFVVGRKITELTDEDRDGIDGPGLAERLQVAYMKQFCIDGFFHADPHPGNVMLTADGQVALLDLGMVGRVSTEMRERLLRLLIALGEGRPEQAADLAVKIGHPGEQFRERDFRDRIKMLVNAFQGMPMEQIQLGTVVMDLARAAGDTGMRPPSELTMIGKALMNLDELGRSLAPGFDPYEAIRRSAIPLVLKMIRQNSTPAALLGRALEVNEFANQLPGRVNKILDRVAENRLEFKVRSFDEQQLMEGFQKVANRIAHGLVLAALIIGAAMLMGVETDFRILGYPGFAILLFVAAAAGGVALVWDIMRHDRRMRRK